MPKAEVGSTKYLNNKLKSKGLQRLRWYCQVCERQMRDENGFKCHTQSESHVRQMLVVGEDPKKAIEDYSKQFQSDFTNLLRTSHGEKKVQVNHFYQEYIRNKEHVHMNSTKWTTLTEFAKFLGKEGICRVEGDDEKGVFVSYIDRSPDALKRQEAIKRKERQDKGDEEREQRALRQQAERAHQDRVEAGKDVGIPDPEGGSLTRQNDGEKVKLSLGLKVADTSGNGESNAEAVHKPGEDSPSSSGGEAPKETATPSKVSLKIAPKKPGNVFASAGKKFSGSKKSESAKDAKQQRPMSEMERIMKQEMERKRTFPKNDGNSVPGFKRQRV